MAHSRQPYHATSKVTRLVRGIERFSRVRRPEVYELLGKTLRRSPSQAKAQVAALGESVGRWRAEQKVAAAGAWLIS